jgi:hypothetical protein
MKTVMVFVAGAMFLSTAFGNDPGFEERYRMKTGRYTPAEEARRLARAKPVMNCAEHGCCTNHEEQAAGAKSDVTLGDASAETRFRMKFGRSSPAEESRVVAAKHATDELVLVASANIREPACCNHGQ